MGVYGYVNTVYVDLNVYIGESLLCVFVKFNICNGLEWYYLEQA